MSQPVVSFTIEIWVQQNTKNRVQIINGTWSKDLSEKLNDIVDHLRGIEKVVDNIREFDDPDDE